MVINTTGGLSVSVNDWLMLPSTEEIVYGIRTYSEDPCFPKPTCFTRRSYLDYQNFRQLLVSRHKNLEVPALPDSRLFLCAELETKTDTQRFLELETFLGAILEIPKLKQDPCLQLFMQSVIPVAKFSKKVESQDGENGSASSSNNSSRQTLESSASDTQNTENSASGRNAPAYDAYEPIFEMEDI